MKRLAILFLVIAALPSEAFVEGTYEGVIREKMPKLESQCEVQAKREKDKEGTVLIHFSYRRDKKSEWAPVLEVPEAVLDALPNPNEESSWEWTTSSAFFKTITTYQAKVGRLQSYPIYLKIEGQPMESAMVYKTEHIKATLGVNKKGQLAPLFEFEISDRPKHSLDEFPSYVTHRICNINR